MLHASSPRKKSSSPFKQNASPRLKKYENSTNQQYIIQDLCRIIKELGGTLPSSVKGQEKNQNQIKLIDNSTTNKTVNAQNQLRIKISDYEFQLKKMTQDFAQYKLFSKLEKQKSVKKLKEEIQENKKRFHDQNINWQKRFAKRMSEYETQTKQFQQKIILKYSQQKKQQIDKISMNFKCLQQAYLKQIAELKLLLANNQEKLTKEHAKQISALKDYYIQELGSQNKKNLEIVKKTEEKYESKIINIEIQKKIQIKKQQEVIKQSSQSKERYVNEIYFLKKDKKMLQQNIDKLQMTIKVLNKRIQERNAQIQSIKAQHQAQKVNLQLIYSKKSADLQKKWDAEKMQIMKDHYNNLQSCELRIQKQQTIRQTMQNHYKQLFKTLQKKFNERTSKKQDIQKLRKMQTQICQKQRQLIQYQNYIKMTQLQRQNNEKNYTRIFTAQGSRQKKPMDSTRQYYKEHTDVKTIFKHSNTTDLKYLLKICHKDF